MTQSPPVLFFVFNRIETTARVFERIAEARPATLLVVADGPRPDHPGDARRCQAVRDLVGHPRWDCDLRTNFAPVNLGFKKRIGSGLEWAFSQFEELIVLEDDCLPDPTFFRFCAEMLERYRSVDRVKMISGGNFQFGRTRGVASYYISRGVGTWGWASWRRAFAEFDVTMRTWPATRASDLLNRIWPVGEAADYWRARFDEAYSGQVDAWDYQWAYSMWSNDGVQAVANTNLIEYIGCLPGAAHTNDPESPVCNIPTGSMAFPLRHVAEVQPDLEADLFEFYRTFQNLGAEEADRRSAALAGPLGGLR